VLLQLQFARMTMCCTSAAAAAHRHADGVQFITPRFGPTCFARRTLLHDPTVKQPTVLQAGQLLLHGMSCAGGLCFAAP
jgi:hypothetical protein